ncbi:hypothetical protein DEI93_03335 [Curtobacterium sp. MCBD17_035]|nr:hypothetical protein [Curtobacterium sp. MCBD17_035]WIB68091.1 hypothetical protein DEI93_03335 [Curtobacterium sp. MCBD17_035]
MIAALISLVTSVLVIIASTASIDLNSIGLPLASPICRLGQNGSA